MVCTARVRLSSSALPQAYTIVLTPSAISTSAGPMTGSVVPVSATAAEMVPTARSAFTSSGLLRFSKATAPLASTSTAGAAAVWRTVKSAFTGSDRGDVVGEEARRGVT